jgi:hypothetical protein
MKMLVLRDSLVCFLLTGGVGSSSSCHPREAQESRYVEDFGEMRTRLAGQQCGI